MDERKIETRIVYRSETRDFARKITEKFKVKVSKPKEEEKGDGKKIKILKFTMFWNEENSGINFQLNFKYIKIY